MLTFAVLTTTCGSASSPEASEPPATSVSQTDADTMIAGLCEMSVELGDDVVAARTVFYDDVHERLHRFATKAEVIDTALAGALLEAKQLVEADLESAAVPTDYGGHLNRLLAVTQDAVVQLGFGDPGCAG